MYKYLADRLLIFIASMVYIVAIHLAHRGYLSDQELIPFYTYEPLEVLDYLWVLVYVLIISLFIPNHLEKISSIFIYILYLFLYLPLPIIVLGEKWISNNNKYAVVLASLISFIFISLPPMLSGRNWTNGRRININRFGVLFLLIWIALAIIFWFRFGHIINFAGPNEIYSQRSAGMATSLFEGYLQVYFGYFASVLLLAFGLYTRRVMYQVFGIIGCILLYGVTAEKTIFLMPLYVYLIHRAIVSKYRCVYLLSIFMFASALSFIYVELSYIDSSFSYWLGFYYLTRIVTIPALFLAQYFEYFSDHGLTYWGHVSGIAHYVAPSSSLYTDPLFPQLGKIIARDVHGINSNSNASFLATDGAAAFGVFGVITISLMLSCYLLVLDFVGRRWPIAFTAPALSPLAFILTNGSLFTALLSFGGLLWLLIFFIGDVAPKNKQRDTEHL